MNTVLLKSIIVKNKDTQKRLAEAMGISLSALNAKINGHIDFWQSEIEMIRNRYALNSDELQAIFFDKEVS